MIINIKEKIDLKDDLKFIDKKIMGIFKYLKHYQKAYSKDIEQVIMRLVGIQEHLKKMIHKYDLSENIYTVRNKV